MAGLLDDGDVIAWIFQRTKPYTVAVLRPGVNRHADTSDAIIREHGRRYVALREQGIISIYLPFWGDADISGIGVFERTADEVHEILQDDPGVQAGVFDYTLYTGRGFPGDALR